MIAKNHYDKATEKWFKEHPDAETTVMKCDACGLFYKPILGHVCKKEKKMTMPKLTCYDCIHCSACSDAGDPGFSYLKEDVSKCKHFRNKAEYMIVKNEKPDIAAVKRFINILKSHAYYIEFPKVHRVVDEDDIDATLKDMTEVETVPIMTLQQAIENPLECEEKQLKNWLTQLSEYIKRDTDVTVERINLCGNPICPVCGESMALSVKNFCDRCGQKIKRNEGSL